MMLKTLSSVLVVAACAVAYAGGLKFDIASDRADATYKLGEQAVFTVKVMDASGAPAKSGRVIFDSIGWGHDASKGKGGPALAKWFAAQDKVAD